jgi:hypothetical protein
LTNADITAIGQGAEDITATATDTASNTATSSVKSITVDTIAPDAVDLDPTTGIQASSLVAAGSSQITAGIAFDSDIATPSATDIKEIKIVLGGAALDVVNDRLVLNVELALGSDHNGDNITIGTIAGIDYRYTNSDKTLVISKGDASSFSASQIESIIEAIKLKNAQATPANGERTATISYIDTASNEGASATATINVQATAPTISSITDNQSDGVTGSAVTYTVVFSHALNQNSFTSADVKIINASNSDITANWAIGTPTTSDGISWTVAVTPPTGANSINTTAVRLKIDAGSITDIYGNTNAELVQANSTQSFDTQAPTLLSQTQGTIGASNDLELSFSESMAKGVGNIIIYDASNNTAVQTINIASDGTVTGGVISFSGSSVTINPDSDLTVGISYYAKVDAGALTDSAGNTFSGITGTGDWSFNAQNLTTSVTWSGTGVDISDGYISATELSNLTITGALGNYNGATGITISSIVFIPTDGSTNITITSGITQPGADTTGSAWTLANNSTWTNQLQDGKSYSVTVNLVSTGAGTPSGSGNAFAVNIDTSAGVTINSIAGDDTINSIESANPVTISGSTSSVENGRTVTVELTGTGYTTTSYTTTVNNNAWSLSIPSSVIGGLSDQEYIITANVTDAQGNIATQVNRTITVAKSPQANGLEYGDTDNDGSLEAGETITVKFSEVVDLSKLSIASFTVDNAHTLGTGASLTQTSGFASSVTITLGTGANIAGGDIITVIAAHIVNANGNSPSADLTYSIPTDITPPPAPTFNSAILFSDNTINASEISSGSVSVLFDVNTGQVINGMLTIYVNGVAKNTLNLGSSVSSPVTVTLSAADLGSDGVKGINTTVTDAAGNESSLSATKNITLDTVVDGLDEIVLTTDQGTADALDSGDEVTFTFAESVKLNDGGNALDAFHIDTKNDFGTGATVTAVGVDVNGYSTQWKVTLGSSPTLSITSDIILLTSQVKDIAGNTNNAPISMNVPDNIFSARQAPTIENVATNNVVDSTEKEAGVTITVSLADTKALAGDNVKLYLDGELVKTSSNLTASDISNGTITVTMDAADWGSDGLKGLTAKVDATSNTPPSNLSNESPIREVQVSADGSHWSANNMIWFDPNMLSGASGSLVDSWTAAAGNSVASGNGGNQRPTLYKTSDGNSYLLFNGSSNTLAFTDPDSVLPAGSQNLNIFTVARATSTAGTWRWITAAGDGGNSSFSLGQNATSIAVSGYGGANDYLLDNAVTIGADSLFTATLRNNKTLALYGSGDEITDPTADNILSSSYSFDPAKRYISGQSHASTTRNEAFEGRIMDVIWSSAALTTAEQQEIETYLAAKWKTSGTEVVSSTNNYNLTTSSVSSGLIDQRMVGTSSADTIFVAGSDYVRALGGNDTVTLSDFNFRQLDGGKGSDTLNLSAIVAPTTINLSDHVSEARANSNGWHKLYGFEKIDLTGSTFAQTLILKAEDIDQLSDTKTLEVILGSNDVLTLKTLGLTEISDKTYDGTTYTHAYEGTVGTDAVKLYIMGGTIEIEGTTIVDTIVGTAQAEIIRGLAGDDTLTGNGGIDIFDYNSTTDGNDTITDFTMGSGADGDKLDLADLLDGYTSGSTLADFITLTDDSTDTSIAIDINGDSSGTDLTIVLTGATGTSLADMISDGNLILL